MYKLSALLLLLLFASCETEDWSKPGNLVPLTVEQDSSIPSLEINGTLLHVESFGNPTDPLIVMIHGGPGGDFRSLLNAKDFADDGYFVVFYDQRGTGLSRRENEKQFQDRNAVQLFIDDLDKVIHHFQTAPNQKVFLIGHSWGAMLATAYINQNPDNIDGAVLAEPGGFTWPQTTDYLSRSNHVKFFNEALNNALYPEQIIAGTSEDELLDYRASFFSDYENAPGNVIGNAGPYPFWRNGAVSARELNENADKFGFDFTTNLQSFQKKVLFLYSERNQAYGEDWARKVSDPYVDVDLAMVKGCGHEMLYWGWTEFYPLALNYLNHVR